MKHLLTKLLLLLYLSSYLSTQEVPRGASLTKKEWRLCEKFILEQADDFFLKGILIIPPQEDLPYPVEKDPNTGSIFIHLKDNPQGFLGKGTSKIVTKSILYSQHAFVVARCETDQAGKNEAEILGHLQHVRGIERIYSLIERDSNHYDFFVEYGNQGTLKNALRGKLHLQTKDLLSVLLDLASGLQGIHEKGYFHRDIKKTNVFISTKDGEYHGIIGDFGCARLNNLPSDGDFCIPDENTPPEIYSTPFSEIDRTQADTYSLGVLFYIIIFEKKLPWRGLIRKCLLNKFSEAEKINRLHKIEALYEKNHQTNLKCFHGEHKEAAKLAFTMLHPDPTKRPSLLFVQEKLHMLLP